MEKFNLSQKQREALKQIGGSYEIKDQYGDDTILIQIHKAFFTITPSGIVEEIKGQKAEGKAEKKAPKYTLTIKQEELLESNHNPAIIRQLSNHDLVVRLKGEDWVFGYDGLNMSKKEYDAKYGAKAPAFTPTKPYVSYTKTVCQERPETCKPRQIEHVAWDADHTIWNLAHGIANSVTGPLKKIDDDTVIELSSSTKPKKTKGGETPGVHQYKDFWTELADENEGWWKQPESVVSEGKEMDDIKTSLLEGLTDKDIAFLDSLEVKGGEEQKLALPPGEEPAPEKEPYEINRITLLPTFRETLDKLVKAGIKNSVISLNGKGTVSRILEAFGLADRFVEIRDSWENKGKVFKEITHAHNLCPCASIFVDDTTSNVRDVAKECGMGLVIGKSGDVERPLDIFRFIKES